MRLQTLITALLSISFAMGAGADVLTDADIPRIEVDKRVRPPKVVQRAKSMDKVLRCRSCGGDGVRLATVRCSGPG